MLHIVGQFLALRWRPMLSSLPSLPLCKGCETVSKGSIGHVILQRTIREISEMFRIPGKGRCLRQHGSRTPLNSTACK